MGRRTILLIAALVVAAVGTTMVFLYVNGVNDRAIADQKPVKVLFAKTEIAAGTTVDAASSANAFEIREVSANSAAPGAISDLTVIANQVALSPIFPGEQILSAKFGQPGSTSTLPIPEGKLAVSVQLGDPARVAGFVAPGSKVAIFLTITPPKGANAGADETALLLPSVEVIATGATTLVPTTTSNGSTTQTEQLPKAIITLAVDQTQYQKIVYGSGHGQMYFGLLGDTSKVSTSVPATNGQNLFN